MGEEDILMKGKYHSETVQIKYPHRRRFDTKVILHCEDEQLITILIHLEKDIYICYNFTVFIPNFQNYF